MALIIQLNAVLLTLLAFTLHDLRFVDAVSVDGDGADIQSALSDLKAQLAALTNSLQSRVSHEDASSRSRKVRSITDETVSGFFGQINSASYGNCTCRGERGPVGQPGLPGRDGRDGRDAPVLCQAPASITEPNSAHGPPTQEVPTGRGGGVYVRWGRTVCSEGTELIYEGIVGGARYTHTGTAANYQCLPLAPLYDDDLVTPGTQDPRAYMYGAEYQSAPMSDPAWATSTNNDHGPPCAVCMATGRPTILMIPARNVCPSSSWTLEYNGLLMASRYNHERTEFVCVDRNPEAIPRTSSSVNGALLYPVESKCSDGNSMPCGPYIDGHESSCAVCSL